MSTQGMYDLLAVVADLIHPLHKILPNGTLSCSLNSEIVIELINDPLIVPRSLRSTGDFNECEYVREPDHRLVSSPWHAYIPVDETFPSSDIKAWVFEDTLLPLEIFAPTHGRNGRISTMFLKKVEAAVVGTQSWLTTVYAIYGPPEVPFSLDFEHLKSFHGSCNELSVELWKVRRSVLVAWGYIIFCLVRDADGWKRSSIVTTEFINTIVSSRLLELPRRGLIIDAQDPPPFEDIVSYIRHSVPVHYYWKPGCVHWLDPAATQSVNLSKPRASPLRLTAPPGQDSFWSLGEFPPFHGEVHKQRIFVSSDGGVTRKEISDQPVLIQELQQRCTSRLFLEPTGNVLLLYDEPEKEINATQSIEGLDVSEKAAPLNTPQPSQPSDISLPFITIPAADIIDSLNRTLAIDNDKARWIIQQFNQPHASLDSDVQVPRIPLPNSLGFVTRGQLVVSKRTEARLALWRAQYPNVPLWFLGYRCLSLGMDWRVFTSMSDLLPPTLEHPPSWLHTDPVPLTSDSSVLIEYVRRVQTLLEVPHARRFLTMGGIAWRIALHYGPSGLFASAISGPSSDASAHLHFEQGVGEGMVDDRVSEAEISLLLGVSARGSIWPTLDIWERSENWTGEWTVKAEMWFQRHVEEISSNSLTSILTRQQWKAKLRQHTLVNFNKPTRCGTEAHAASVCVGLKELFPPVLSITLDS